MESVIAGLLQEFENGRLTRRQLIQSLALAAAAAAPGGTLLAQGAQKASTIPAPKDAAPWKTVWLDHISYAVSDYRRSAAFYRDLMGWEIKHDNGRNQCSMRIGHIGGIIVRNNGHAAGQQRITGVIDHVSWGIEPWETATVKAELKRR